MNKKISHTTSTTTPGSDLLPRIEGRIQTIRGLRVMIDADLANLYGVPTSALNQAVKRNSGRFPQDFMFQLDPAEKLEVITNCDHLAKLKFSRTMPFAFTEYGAVALANVLASTQAVEMGIYVVRAFVRLRQAASLHADLAKRLAELEDKTERLELSHDTFSHNTRAQLKKVFDALRELMTPPEPPPPPKRSIGFITPEDKGSGTGSSSKGSRSVKAAVKKK
jgi:hypothetical protein